MRKTLIVLMFLFAANALFALELSEMNGYKIKQVFESNQLTSWNAPEKAYFMNTNSKLNKVIIWETNSSTFTTYYADLGFKIEGGVLINPKEYTKLISLGNISMCEIIDNLQHKSVFIQSSDPSAGLCRAETHNILSGQDPGISKDEINNILLKVEGPSLITFTAHNLETKGYDWRFYLKETDAIKMPAEINESNMLIRFHSTGSCNSCNKLGFIVCDSGLNTKSIMREYGRNTGYIDSEILHSDSNILLIGIRSDGAYSEGSEMDYYIVYSYTRNSGFKKILDRDITVSNFDCHVVKRFKDRQKHEGSVQIIHSSNDKYPQIHIEKIFTVFKPTDCDENIYDTLPVEKQYKITEHWVFDGTAYITSNRAGPQSTPTRLPNKPIKNK